VLRKGSGQLLAHLIGDYLLQSDWMALGKVTGNFPAAVHALTYTIPFVILTRSPYRLAFISGSHFAIDRWRLARYVCWAKNNLAPPGFNPPWSECQATGYPSDRPVWMTVWLMILADNTLHGVCNWLALEVRHAETSMG
jgi:Protein of unknown function (DUF3307)